MEENILSASTLLIYTGCMVGKGYDREYLGECIVTDSEPSTGI